LSNQKIEIIIFTTRPPKGVDTGKKKTVDYWKKIRFTPTLHTGKNLRHWKKKLKNLYFEPFCS
jgi:hypothetical protein